METKSLDKKIDNHPFVIGVRTLIEKNLKIYNIDSSRITADYRGETGITSAYNGRQLLELLQNADDEGTAEVLIELNNQTQTLSISNNGEQFTVEGIASLMLANNSVKKIGRKKNYIGNKGLGFRSILNWTNSIEIITKEVILKFSPLIAKKYFEEIVVDSELRKKLIEQEEIQDFVPFAVLAIPEIAPNTNEQFKWETSIRLNYKTQAYVDIENQLEALKPEILLFLNNIRRITYSINGEETVIEKEYPLNGDQSLVVINDNKWNIKDSGERKFKGEEDKHYHVKIAWKDDLSDRDTTFFTYFPTQVKTHFPCLIHASFELDPTRNQINPIDENRYVLREVANLLCELAVNELQPNGTSDWRAFRLLTPMGVAENKLLQQNVNEILVERKNELAIYPCVDGQYRTIDKVVFFQNEFSNWIITNKFEKYFPELLLALDEDIKIDSGTFIYKYTALEFTEKITEISKLLGQDNIDQRATLIAILLRKEFEQYHEPETSTTFPLLIDTNGEVISEKNRVFTLKKGSIESLGIPNFVKISFIDIALRESLESILDEKLAEEKYENENDNSRALKRLLSPIVNIGSNDIIDVISTIISETNERANYSSSFKDDLSKSLVSLFKIFEQDKDRNNILVYKILLLNKNGEIRKSNELFLSRFYPSGKLTEEVFEGVYDATKYLTTSEDLGFDSSESPETLENFYLWLGVNKHIILKPIEFNRGAKDQDDYLNFVFPNIELRPKPVSQYYYEGLEIDNFIETFKNISPEKLILLLAKDERLKQKIDSSHGDILQYQYGQSYNPIICKSYIQFQLQSLYNFNEFLLDDNEIPFLNKFRFDIKNELFKKYGIKEPEINYILSKLGAKISFNELGIETIYDLIKNCKLKDPEFKYGRRLYFSTFT